MVTLLIQLVHRIGKRAERRVEAAYLNDLKRVAGKTRILYRIADAALEHPDEPVREVVFPVANEQTLRDLVAEYKAQGRAYRQQVQEVMRSSYRHNYRQILPVLLEVLDFHSNNTAYQPMIQALAVVRAYVETIPERGQTERLLRRVSIPSCFSTAIPHLPSKLFAPVLEWSRTGKLTERRTNFARKGGNMI